MGINAFHRFAREVRHAQRRADEVEKELADPRLAFAERLQLGHLLTNLLRRLPGRGPRPTGADTMTRQRRRAELRKEWYGQYANRTYMPRAERRAIARAGAARDWKRERDLPLAA